MTNAHGDPVDEDGNVTRVQPSGESVHVILGGQSVAVIGGRGEVASTEGMIGVSTADDITLEHGDMVGLDDGTQYRVIGPMLWGRPHSLTGTPARYAWWRAVAVTN